MSQAEEEGKDDGFLKEGNKILEGKPAEKKNQKKESILSRWNSKDRKSKCDASYREIVPAMGERAGGEGFSMRENASDLSPDVEDIVFD